VLYFVVLYDVLPLCGEIKIPKGGMEWTRKESEISEYNSGGGGGVNNDDSKRKRGRNKKGIHIHPTCGL